MIELVLAAGFGTVLIGLSVRANASFRQWRRLPMQWSSSGAVNWTAPRLVALAFTPALAIATLSATAILARFVKPRPGQEGMLVPALVAVGLAFVAAHLLHLWLIARTLRRGDR